MKKIALFFLIFLFLACCNLKDLDFERIPESATMMEKIQEGIIANTEEGFLADSIKGIFITWEQPATIGPEISSKLSFFYSESPEELKKLSDLKGHKVRLTYFYEDDGRRDGEYMPIARMVRVEDLGK
ncbi:MAG: hypothetical protein A2V69_01050 [Candidatus Portnoybacteria bacterium RBG_13_40_8]|uniref:Uncharacterized protein n=1 Tax=Candidatus Portnoybacteria bacterium RBG_13_40_8 TaxID=1801990 RepID=A0A1G2F2P3_9BACT|nr:MAG: hypothetical protein A2V69_01050 [Candidatus Portnoybacteria bacterium RBG_13_40_8]